MFELLLVVIGVLALLLLLLVGRSRRSGGDPSSSVEDFHRALTAMGPGDRVGGGRDEPVARGEDDAEQVPAAGDEQEERDSSSR